MDRTRIARSLLSTAAATFVATSLALAAMPAARGAAPDSESAVDGEPRAEKRLEDDKPLEANPALTAPGIAPELLAKAAPDECFGGSSPPPRAWAGCEDGQPKVNQSYVWGLAASGDNLWFGTAPNVQCLTIGTSLAVTAPIENDDYVCEYGESPQRSENPAIPPAGGDWRPPKIYVYNKPTRKMVDKTAAIRGRSEVDRQRLESTVGIRAAGSHQGVVLLGGPSILGLNLFAFDGTSGRYLGSTTLPAYGTIRNFLVADHALYAGVGMGIDGQAGGAVLRWAGSKRSPFAFSMVASLPQQVADLVVHKGRMFVTTWPSVARSFDSEHTAGVWMSPYLVDGSRGLTTADINAWKQVWNVSQYEPDPVVAATYGLGGLASYDGNLYWGTMHVPMKAAQAHTTRYAPESEAQNLLATKNTQRSASIFRASRFDKGKATADLLYGAAELPAFDPEANNGAGDWQLKPTGYKPRYGAAGFGSSYNNYTWKMLVAGGSLYIGTMDWSYLVKDLPVELRSAVEGGLGAVDPASYGGDLWEFDGTNGPAKPVDTSGVGNYLNYGIRTMVVDGPAVYLGMANPMNLRTDRSDDIPEGGWELIRLPGANAPSTAKEKTAVGAQR
ncbi:hypothetical protein GCM10022225_12990 [Plantactinospora mayteni]|uniref:Uncharacterized protein n=1 Tax=Plantactinospora mayteni TaxID=566021 RepID=A0ABQ4EGU4_9ACTN|nr:hypothetical protein [Plantactinospora mayteni]GIG93948.1 hypothetical protein Pma05_05210 [Plantactinospora mayteni]